MRRLALLVAAALTLATVPAYAAVPPTPAWSTPTGSISGALPQDRPLDVAASRDGSRVVAVWAHSGAVYTALARVSAGVAAWAPVQALSAPVDVAADPVVAMSADGSTVVAAWTGDSGTVVRSRAASVAGSTATWGPPEDIAAGTVSLPRLALSEDGLRLAAAWVTGARKVWAAPGSLSGTALSWGPVPEQVGGTMGDVSDVALVISGGGTLATVVWGDDLGGRVSARSATLRSPTQTWGDLAYVTDGSIVVPDFRVARSRNGSRVVVVWNEAATLAGPFAVRVRSAAVSGTTQTWRPFPTTLSDAAVGSGASPVVAVSDDGSRAVAAWSMTTPAPGSVRAAASILDGADDTWGPATRLVDAAADSVDGIGLSADGTVATLAWTQDRDARASTGAMDGTSSTWTAPTTLNLAGSRVSRLALGTAADGSTATAVWSRTDPDLSSNRFLQSASTVAAPPLATSVSPAGGSDAGGTVITVSGSGFATGDTVTVGGAACTKVAAGSASSLTCATPPHPAGAVDVTVTDRAGRSSTLPAAFTYAAAPSPSPDPTPTPGPGVPGAVRAARVKVDPSRTWATLRWKPPASNGGAHIKGYKVRLSRKKNPDRYQRFVTVTATRIKLLYLAKRTNYNVQVAARNRAGLGPLVTVAFTTRRR